MEEDNLKELLQVILEAYFQHLVGLVEDKDAERAEP
jgi:hypothetical protein